MTTDNHILTPYLVAQTKEKIRIDYLPESFVAELQQWRKDKSISNPPTFTISQFLEQILDSDDIKYNHFKVWTHNLLVGWLEQLEQLDDGLFRSDEHFVLPLLFYALTTFIQSNADNKEPRLEDFWSCVDGRINEMYIDFDQHSWYCLLGVLDDLNNNKKATQPKSLNVTESKTSNSSRKSRSKRVSNLANAVELRNRFNQQIEFLKSLTRQSFRYKFHLELLRQMVIKTFFWNEIQSYDHRIQKGRAYYDVKKAKKAADASETETDVGALKEVILPLNMAVEIDQDWWDKLFGLTF